MLPETHHHHDEKWLQEQFSAIIDNSGINRARVVAEKYSIAYQNTYETTEINHKKHNKARYEANSRLLKMVKSLTAKPLQPTA